MIPGKYVVEKSTFPELKGAVMDVDKSGDHGSFAFPDGPSQEMEFSNQDRFKVEGPGGKWHFDVTFNLVVLNTDKIKADGKVKKPDSGGGPDDDGTFTSTATTGQGVVEDTTARAATEGYGTKASDA